MLLFTTFAMTTSFEDYLRRCMRTEWSYLDYAKLKEKLKSFYKRRHQFQHLIHQQQDGGYLSADDVDLILEGGSSYSATEESHNQGGYFQYTDEQSNVCLVDPEDALLRLSIQERKEFSALLEAELVKVASFYNQTILVQLKSLTASTDEDNFELAAAELLEAMAFCVANVITFRQILIRYDAFRRTFDGMPLTEWHLQRSKLSRDHPVHALFHLEDLTKIEEQLISDMQEHGITTDDLSVQLRFLRDMLDKTSGSVQRAVAGHVIFRDRVLWTIRQSILFGLQSYGLNLEPKFLVMRGRHFKAEIEAVTAWRESRGFKTTIPQDTFASRLKELEPGNVLPLLLNLISCFFFMMNNYIIEPSSAYYASALGSSDALSGIMIGAAPWFALVSSIVYSYWTNYSYKAPILFASTLMLIGNILYSNAYSYESMEMCLVGRAITGLGAPRIINRRYMADATPFSLRTVASASFMLATALGAALGPGMAIVLDMFEFEFSLPLLGKQYFNGMTGPGYFMALCWSLYTLAILLFFKEPVRSGLDELKQREQRAHAADRSASDQRSDSLMESQEMLASGAAAADDDDASCDDAASVGSSDIADDTCIHRTGCYGCLQHVTRPVLICMSLIFMKRIALESIVGSTSVITKNRFHWSVKNVGTLHLINGMIIIPVSAIAGWLSTFYEDRYMAIWFLAITLFGMTFLVDLSDFIYHDNETYNEGHWLAVGPVKYIAGSLIAFSGIEACESYVASLMSKVVPSALACGTFNSGLLATLVGTGGRATGDLFITLMGLISIRSLLNLLILPGAALVIISIALIRYNYEILGI